MTSHASQVTLHMVSSLDGFIAKKDGDTSWLHSTDHYEPESHCNEAIGDGAMKR